MATTPCAYYGCPNPGTHRDPRPSRAFYYLCENHYEASVNTWKRMANAPRKSKG